MSYSAERKTIFIWSDLESTLIHKLKDLELVMLFFSYFRPHLIPQLSRAYKMEINIILCIPFVSFLYRFCIFHVSFLHIVVSFSCINMFTILFSIF